MKYLLHTYGCQMNVRDSEAVAARLEEAGHLPATCEDDADLIIVNTCSVRGKAEDKAVGKLGILCAGKRTNPNRRVGVMGCMAQRRGGELLKRFPGLDFAAGSRREREIPEAIDRLLAGESQLLLLDTPDPSPVVSHEHGRGILSTFVTILLGCNRRCAYCVVPDVRGPEYSRPAAEVVDEVTRQVGAGAREVTLLGQSVLNYGRSNPVWKSPASPGAAFREDFPRLLETLDAIPGLRRLRFTSGHPSGCTEELVRAMRDLPRVCPHLHLPVQSGSDRILALMRRGYTAAAYLDAVARLRKAMPDFSITSDVIVGFPSETEADFEATRRLMATANFDNAFVFKYSPRPNTPAAKMPDDVPSAEKMRRNRILLDDLDVCGQRLNEATLGQTLEVLVEGVSLRNERRWSGRTAGNKIVVFDPVPGMAPGDLAQVRIERAAPQTLHGTVSGKQ